MPRVSARRVAADELLGLLAPHAARAGVTYLDPAGPEATV